MGIATTVELGKALRARRRQAGLTQGDVAALAGVGLRFVSELERGKPTAQVGKTLQILKLLGLELQLVPREEAR